MSLASTGSNQLDVKKDQPGIWSVKVSVYWTPISGMFWDADTLAFLQRLSSHVKSVGLKCLFLSFWPGIAGSNEKGRRGKEGQREQRESSVQESQAVSSYTHIRVRTDLERDVHLKRIVVFVMVWCSTVPVSLQEKISFACEAWKEAQPLALASTQAQPPSSVPAQST